MRSQRGRPDHYARKAKAEGRPARSAYKLEEIDKRWKLLRPGARVLDLGSAPGSWLQYAGERVGAQGVVEGYDLKPITLGLPRHVTAHVGDAFEIRPVGHAFDVVLSDMAPATMGDHKTDAIRSAGLAERALDMADARLCQGGHVVVKVLKGGDVPQMIQRIRKTYTKVELLRPKATRRDSTEIFLVGLGKKEPPSHPDESASLH